MSIQRRTMKFLVPITVTSLGRSDMLGRAVVPFYINPQNFKIQDKKIISESLTKGGYSVQYWGENLGDIQASGTTGSGGIEAINILRGVYRNEITQFNSILLERALNQDQDFRTALDGISPLSGESIVSIGGGVTSILDEFTRNGFQGVIDGVSSSIEAITNAAIGNSNTAPASVDLIPSMGSYAVSMILYWQGEKFQGYFTNFGVTESANSPGLFDYDFSFKIVKRIGSRSNFMPWHRKPTDNSGAARTASVPSEGAREDELSFITSTQQEILASQGNFSDPSLNNNNSITSIFQETQESDQNDNNRVSINRNGQIRGV